MRGKGSLSHNRRDFIAENVDSSRTPLNVEYHNEDIRAVYHELFDDALARYNEKQTRRDRVIDDYYEKIRMGKQEKLFEELIIQIGNMKPRRIFILISFRSQPAASADSKPVCRSKRHWKHSALRAAQKVTLS